jgi:glycosyltransferase involved in cell wall biosynthesis
VAEVGARRSFAELRSWRPDVVYSHKVEDPKLEAETLCVAPSVYFAHDYQGMCISGTKTFKFPVVKPCGRSFGRKCLAHYYPHRCGGLSPLTMMKLYRLQIERRELLHRYHAIVTHSEHMLAELIKHGLSAQQAYRFPYYVHPTEAGAGTSEESTPLPILFASASDDEEPSRETSERTNWHLLFSGRMELLKGGHVFLDALPTVAAALDKPLRVTFAGDGRLRGTWERMAAHLQDRDSRLDIEFIGWADRSRVDSLLNDCDLQVVPSLWPEPFGLVGPEAGLRGVPVAAFAVGGIADWLADGINGYLAPGDRPTSEGLADAIIHCLRDPLVHARLRRGALQMAKRFNIKNHLTALLEVFESVARRGTLPDSVPLEPKTRVG